MSEQQTDTDASGGTTPSDGDAAPVPAKKSKKLILLGGIGAVLLLGAGGGAWMLLGGSGKAPAPQEAAADAPKDDKGGGEAGKEGEHFVDVPAMVVNLRSADGAARFLKVHLMLVPGTKMTPEQITAKLPLLLDAYQPFLRELRPDDLAGSAAVYRVKEEMLVRAHQTLGDGAVKDVLIQDLIQQ
ncbi:flagellar basal body-associated FliL family protein [Sphingomonas sp. CARO-RG-8B-R24-01]|uniref:flagellar basal body-associated FliL family protein n=1 Tax=Sphingomonas sp. CARO-RG-8B-R24-01 TaxID=2914831 RepID=UPI001F58B4C1|nr:flagellar basal body-associated FliL family protein [Sphingomonas sp. CARO-RG-8B-R24-01]